MGKYDSYSHDDKSYGDDKYYKDDYKHETYGDDYKTDDYKHETYGDDKFDHDYKHETKKYEDVYYSVDSYANTEPYKHEDSYGGSYKDDSYKEDGYGSYKKSY